MVAYHKRIMSAKSNSKMSNNKRKRKEETEKMEGDRRSNKCIKRKRDVLSPERPSVKQKKSLKDHLYSAHHVTKSSHRQTEEKDNNNKQKQRSNTSSVSVQLQGGSSTKNVRIRCSGKSKTISRTKNLERKLSKSSNTSRACSATSQSTKTSKERKDKQPSLDSSSKSKKPKMSQSSLNDQKQSVKKVEKHSRTPCHSSTSKTQEPASDFSKCSSQQKSIKEVTNSHKSHQAKELPAKGHLSTDAKDLPVSTTEKSTSSTKHPILEKLSGLWTKVTSNCESDTSASQKTEQLSLTEKQNLSLKFVPFKFRIPKKSQRKPEQSSGGNDNATSTNKNVENTNENKLSESGVLERKPELEVGQVCKGLDGGQDKVSTPDVQLPTADDTIDKQGYEQGQVVEEIQSARSENRLEVNVTQSYGELTSMEIDLPEEESESTSYRQPSQQELILVLDTNILLKHLDYVKKIKSHGLGALGYPVVLIPWVVLQELDYLKKGRGQLDSVAHLVTPAISYIYNALKNRDHRLWGQSMQQAAVGDHHLKTENNDDRVLQCCLQYLKMYPECALILCTNDKNLCSKAILSGVTAHSKSDLEVEVKKGRNIQYILELSRPPVLPHVTEVTLDTSHTTLQPCGQMGAVATQNEGNGKRCKRNNKGTKLELGKCIFDLEECLQEVLSDVLEVEMKAAYGNIWEEIVLIKPPWTLQDILKCLKKHWIAVFGHVVPRKMQDIVSHLISFFYSGQTANSCSTTAILQEATKLVKAFWKSSRLVPQAVTKLENIHSLLQPQFDVFVEEESRTCDVTMKDDDDEGKPPIPAPVSPQEVWALFENIWSKSYNLSVEVFKALQFDPHTMQLATPMGDPGPPPLDALACLYRLSSMVSQLRQALTSFMFSGLGLSEADNLLTVIYSSELVNENGRLTPRDLHDCFTQPAYREKLGHGGTQLTELGKTLDGCVQVTGQHFTT